MKFSLFAVTLSLGQFLGMLVCLEIGYRFGRRRSQADPRAHEGLGTIEAAIFALLGLLLGFAFAGATSRLDARRQLVVQEANAIGSAYLLIDVFPSSDQPAMRRLFRDYLDARLGEHEDTAQWPSVERRMTQLQQEMWSRAFEAGRIDPTQNISRLVLPAFNQMIVVTTARSVALRTHLPPLILGLLMAVALACALLAGHAMAKRSGRSLFHLLLYATAVSITIYTVLDLDDPRAGLIRLDPAEVVLQQLHDSIR
jgi:hypothetical protein